MTYFLFHLGDSFPPYIKHSISQIYKHDKKANVYVCGQSVPDFIDSRATFIHSDDLALPNFSYLKNDPDPLWHTSLMRIFAINNFMQAQDIEGVIHFDNDVMLFGDFNKIKEHFDNENYITPHKRTEYAFGFSYLNNRKKFKTLTERIYDLIKQGEDKVKSLTGDEAHEMRLLGYCSNNLIQPLPVHPSLGSIDGCIFDPSSWGQYAGGTPAGHAPGFIDSKQLVGSILVNENIKPTLLYKEDHDTYHIKYNDNIYQIFNLHIHSKNLNAFAK